MSPTVGASVVAADRRQPKVVIEVFGLPTATTVALVGIIGLWIVYTAVFYVVSRNWAVEDVDYNQTEKAP